MADEAGLVWAKKDVEALLDRYKDLILLWCSRGALSPEERPEVAREGLEIRRRLEELGVNVEAHKNEILSRLG